MSARLRAIARETVEIAERGTYRAPGGSDIRIDVAASVAGTRLHLPEDRLADIPGPPAGTTVEVTGESTLVAARRLGGDVAALVFASARNCGVFAVLGPNRAPFTTVFAGGAR